MITTLLVVTQFIAIPVVSANSSTNNQKEQIQSELEQTQKEIDNKLSEASEITIALEDLAKEIDSQESSISKTEADIEEQEELVKDRYEHTAEQLQMMQKSEVNQNIIIGLFQSENFSDFINRLYTMAVLTSANEELLTEAHHEFEKLNEMKEELVVNKQELDEKKEKTTKQKAVLDEKLSDLQSTLVVNQEKLDEIHAQEAAEQKRAEEEKAKKELAKKEQVEESSVKEKTKNTVKVASSKTTAADSKEKSTNQSKASTTKKSGEWMTFESTGYSTQQAGLSSHTATGINLLNNPRVIAVDPSQIPLNSLVEVEGMGVYVAGDTGGAINGRIIDIHFSSVAQAKSWGRRSVRLRILN